MTSTNVLSFDLLIVGGGPTGAALALALSQQNSSLRIGLLDAATNTTNEPPSFDERVLALSEGSRRLLAELGVWDALTVAACPIQQIHVSDRGQFGRTVLSAAEQQLAALGQVVPLRALGQTLYRALATRSSVQRLSGRIVAFAQQSDQVVLQCQQAEQATELCARVVLAADGGPSSLRALASLPIEVVDYEQSAVIATVRAERAHQHWAYERFTETGPLALLPMTENRLSLVWTQTPQEAERLLQLSAPAFLSELQQAFGWRLGAFQQVGAREKFELKRLRSLVRRQGRVVLMGNAATTLHPIAGQGFNLALRDAMAFATQLRTMLKHDDDWSSPAALDTFVQQRRADADHVAGITDSLVRLFSNQHPLLTPLRALGLSALDAISPLRRIVANKAMGLR